MNSAFCHTKFSPSILVYDASSIFTNVINIQPGTVSPAFLQGTCNILTVI